MKQVQLEKEYVKLKSALTFKKISFDLTQLFSSQSTVKSLNIFFYRKLRFNLWRIIPSKLCERLVENYVSSHLTVMIMSFFLSCASIPVEPVQTHNSIQCDFLFWKKFARIKNQDKKLKWMHCYYCSSFQPSNWTFTCPYVVICLNVYKYI